MIELAIYLSACVLAQAGIFVILFIPASIAFLLVVLLQWYIIVTREPQEIVRCDGGGKA